VGGKRKKTKKGGALSKKKLRKRGGKGRGGGLEALAKGLKSPEGKATFGKD